MRPLLKTLGRILLPICLLTLALSCNKIEENVFYFSQEGGVCTLATEFDGASMSIISGEDTSTKALFTEDFANPDNSEWFSELGWIRVHYKPAHREVIVTTTGNETGSDRKARLTALQNGTPTTIAEFRQR